MFNRLGSAFASLLRNLLKSLALLFAMTFISVILFFVISIVIYSIYFSVYLALIFFALCLISILVYASFPFLSSKEFRKAQDGALLIASLLTILGLIEIQTPILKQLQADRDQVFSITRVVVENIPSMSKDECLGNPRADICDYYIKAYKLARNPISTPNDWGKLFDELNKKYDIFTKETRESDLDNLLDRRADMSKMQKVLIGNVFILSAGDQKSIYTPSIEKLMAFDEFSKGDDVKMFGLCFFMLSFATLFARNFATTSED
jgi:hypothetical protein